MPRNVDIGRKREGPARTHQRETWKAQGLTVRGTRPRRMPVEATRAHVDAMQARRDALALDERQALAKAERSKREHEGASVVQLYRAEREAKQQRHAGVMADAKAQYERLLADLKVSQKGGRPRKQVNARRDPADALIAALGGSR